MPQHSRELDEDAEAEARGALEETRANAQQEYGEEDAAHCHNTRCFMG